MGYPGVPGVIFGHPGFIFGYTEVILGLHVEWTYWVNLFQFHQNPYKVSHLTICILGQIVSPVMPEPKRRGMILTVISTQFPE